MHGFPSLKEESEAYNKARLSVLTEGVQKASQWIEHVGDPQLGPVGHEFSKRFHDTGCSEAGDLNHKNSVAIFTSHSLKVTPPYMPNSIVFGPKASENFLQLVISQIHERTHAIQKKNCAALHANFFNNDTKIVLCPRDSILLEERAEEQAYAIQGLFGMIAGRECADIFEVTKADLVSAEDFKKIVATEGNTHLALVKAAELALDKTQKEDDHGGETFRDHYHDLALKHFQDGMDIRKADKDKNFIYVRLEPEDIYALGACCGHNTFGAGGQVLPEFIRAPDLNEENANRLSVLNARCGIADEDKLPTLREALKKAGMTPESFIDVFYNPPTASAAAASSPSGPPPAP